MAGACTKKKENKTKSFQILRIGFDSQNVYKQQKQNFQRGGHCAGEKLPERDRRIGRE
jgi:hypothetical protein